MKSGGEEEYRNFGLIDEGSVRRKHGPDGRLLWAEIKLSEWIFNAIRKSEVLTLHRDYFRLRKPLERRIYELSRKHCGKQPTWQISLEVLLKKSGSDSPMKRFREMVKHIARHDHLPDYSLAYNEAADTVVFINRGGKWVDSVKPSSPMTNPYLPCPLKRMKMGETLPLAMTSTDLRQNGENGGQNLASPLWAIPLPLSSASAALDISSRL